MAQRYYDIQVVDAVTGNPVENARVDVYRQHGFFDYVETIYTHPNGYTYFVITDDIPGSYFCYISKDGYVTTTTEFLFPSINLIYLYPQPTYYNIRVLDSYTGIPVEGAEVKYTDNGSDIIKTTNEDGFSFYSSFNKTIDSVNISKDGYKTKDLGPYHGTSSSDYGESVVLEPENGIRIINGSDSKIEEDVFDDLMVKITSIDDNRLIGKYKVYPSGLIETETSTYYSSGYVETLPTNIYTSGKYFASLMGVYKNVKGENIKEGLTVIDISEFEDTDDDYDDKIELLDDFNEMSAGSIKEHIDFGNNELERNGESEKISYHNTKKDKNNKDADDYRINIINPDSINVYDIFAGTPVEMYNDHKNIIGSVDIGLKEDINELRVKTINRYSGYYNPIFKDILFYNNMTTNVTVKNSEDSDSEDSDYEIELPFSNTLFDYSYEDNYGKFGLVLTIWNDTSSSNLT